MFNIRKPTVYVNKMGDPIRVGDWKREKELGSGGFGVVTLWKNIATGDCLAIKKCKWNLETNLTPKQTLRWSSEVDMMKTIDNENIVCYRKMPVILEQALFKSNPSKLPILSMEFCSLGNLRSELLKPANSCGFQEIEVINLLKDVSNALTYLHNLNITHRDFKPENIVLQSCSSRKTGVIYKVIDLGYAKELSSETVSFVGTLQYLAPEMFENQNYDKSVDYWSLGITAFETICGVRPFLPAFTPVQSFEYVKKKDSDVICIQMTHTGDIKFSKELLKENHINMCLKQNMEKWFRSVLHFDPKKRGIIENNNIVVFESLQSFVSSKIITVFSIYKFEFYSYEINESTLYSTLQDWIARDTKIQKADQYLVATKQSGSSTYAKDYYDEANLDAMLFVFKKNASISETVSASLPKLIKIMFENIRSEFKFGTLKLLSAQIIYFVHQEIKQHKAVKYGIYFINVFLNNMVMKENKLCIDVGNSLHSFLSEIEFYNYIESSLNTKVYKDTNKDSLNALLLEYESYLYQVKEIIDTMNVVTTRHKKLNSKNSVLQHAFIVVFNKLQNCNFTELSNQAIKSYEELIKQNPNTNLTARGESLKIVSQTLKIRDTILRDRYFLHFLKGATCYWSEMNKLISCLTALENHLTLIKTSMRQNNVNRIKLLQDIGKSTESSTVNEVDGNADEIRKENVLLRYNMQEFFDSTISKYKNITKETDMVAKFPIQNGTDDIVYRTSLLKLNDEIAF